MTYFTINPLTGQFDELNTAPGGAIVGPGLSVVGDIATWGDITGNSLLDSGKSFSTDGTLAANSDALISTQKAVKTYVDAATAGITFELPAYAATTGALTAAYANGAAGVGATLTNSGALAAFSTDGVSPPINSRILVKDQASTLQNGMYALTTVGSGAVAWVLTRTTDYDAPSEIVPGTTFIVLNGTTLAGSAWVEVSTVTTVGVDAITFTQYIYPPSTFLQVTNNLSDVASAPTSRSNLGLTDVAIQNVTQYNTLIGGAANAITSVAPSATVGVPLISQGAAADPTYGTAVVAGGGTGATTLTGVLTGNGTSAVTANAVTQYGVVVGGASNAVGTVGPGSAGQVLQSAGGASNPAYSTATYPSVATGTGTVLRADGTNWVASTATYPNTTTANQILYSSAGDVVGQITAANGGVLTTDPSTGVPTIDTTNFVRLSTGMQVKGNNTNTAPPAGFIGEQIRGFAANGSIGSWSSVTFKTITSVALTPGIWDLSATCRFGGGVITGLACFCGIATVTNSTTGYVDADNTAAIPLVPTAAGEISLVVPQYRLLVSANTTYYLTAAIDFSVGTPVAGGRLSAVRVG